MSMASSIVFHIRLYQLNGHLREHYPQIWRVVGTGNEEIGFFAQYNRMTQLSTRYEVNDEALNGKLVVLRRLHQSAAIGALALIAGLLLDLLI